MSEENKNNTNKEDNKNEKLTVYDYFLMQQAAEEECRVNVDRYKKEIYEFVFFAFFFIFIAIMCAVRMAYFNMVWFAFFIYMSLLCVAFFCFRLHRIRVRVDEYKAKLKEIETTLLEAGVYVDALEEDYKKFDMWNKDDKYKPKTIDEMKKEAHNKKESINLDLK